MVEEHMLTTLDNPYNPFTQWDEWFAFDLSKGYDTCGTLARFACTGNNLTEEENGVIIEQAMDDIIDIDPYQRWIKVSKDSAKNICNKILLNISNNSNSNKN